MKNITDYEFIRNRLIVRPINFTDNKYELKDCVYKKIGDIALVLYVLLYDDEKWDSTVKAQKHLLIMGEGLWGDMGRCITEYECLGTAAYVHACRRFDGSSIYSGSVYGIWI